MEVSERDWALAMCMIDRLRKICDAHNEMFGKLTIHLREAEVLNDEQAMALERDFERSYAEVDHEERATSVNEVITQLTRTGAFQGMMRRTIETAFDQMMEEALERFQSGQEGQP